MADKLIHIGQEMAGDAINTVAEQANDFVQDASNKAATDKASTLGEQIANYTCDKLNEKIPNIVGSITNEVISKLRTKIDSEEFTTNFISVLRDKLLDNEEYTDKFLSKFDRLFDTIIKDATLHSQCLIVTRLVVKGRSIEVFQNLCAIIQASCSIQPMHIFEHHIAVWLCCG